MPRINIDDKFFTDRRLDHMAALLSVSRAEVEYQLLRLWHHCYCKAQDTFDHSSIDLQGTFGNFAQLLIKCNLAEEIDGKVRIKGISERIEYIRNARENGMKSALARKKKYGTAQPKPRRFVEGTFDVPRTSSSSSSSSSKEKKKKAPLPLTCLGFVSKYLEKGYVEEFLKLEWERFEAYCNKISRATEESLAIGWFQSKWTKERWAAYQVSNGMKVDPFTEQMNKWEAEMRAQNGE